MILLLWQLMDLSAACAHGEEGSDEEETDQEALHNDPFINNEEESEEEIDNIRHDLMDDEMEGDDHLMDDEMPAAEEEPQTRWKSNWDSWDGWNQYNTWTSWSGWDGWNQYNSWDRSDRNQIEQVEQRRDEKEEDVHLLDDEVIHIQMAPDDGLGALQSSAARYYQQRLEIVREESAAAANPHCKDLKSGDDNIRCFTLTFPAEGGSRSWEDRKFSAQYSKEDLWAKVEAAVINQHPDGCGGIEGLVAREPCAAQRFKRLGRHHDHVVVYLPNADRGVRPCAIARELHRATCLVGHPMAPAIQQYDSTKRKMVKITPDEAVALQIQYVCCPTAKKSQLDLDPEPLVKGLDIAVWIGSRSMKARTSKLPMEAIYNWCLNNQIKGARHFSEMALKRKEIHHESSVHKWFVEYSAKPVKVDLTTLLKQYTKSAFV